MKKFIVSPLRDVPSMVRINGKMVNGRTENEKVLVAYRILHDGLAGNEKLVNLVMSLATQNLGIFMYEKLVKYVQPSRASAFTCLLNIQ